jgi:hypothetical protein
LAEIFRASQFGMTTVSITWMTPLSAAMSAFTTLASSTITVPVLASTFEKPVNPQELIALVEAAIGGAAKTSPTGDAP